jgi:hypothetical protein
MNSWVTRWRFIGVVALAMLLDLAVYLYTESDLLALLCASLLGVAALILIRGPDERR